MKKKVDEDLNTNPAEAELFTEIRTRLQSPGFDKIAEALRACRTPAVARAVRAMRQGAEAVDRGKILEGAAVIHRVFKQAAPNPVAAKPVGDHNDERKSKPRIIRQGAQSIRADVVLKRLFPPDGIPPCREELADADLWDRFSREYARVEGAQHPLSRYLKPSKDTLLRKAGRK